MIYNESRNSKKTSQPSSSQSILPDAAFIALISQVLPYFAPGILARKKIDEMRGLTPKDKGLESKIASSWTMDFDKASVVGGVGAGLAGIAAQYWTYNVLAEQCEYNTAFSLVVPALTNLLASYIADFSDKG